MLTVKQVFELAWAGALHEYEETIQYHNHSLTEKCFKRLEEIRKICDELDKKENDIASSNSATETAVLFALNLKEGEVQKLKAKPAQLYQVRIIHLTGEEQVLRFPILAAAGATLEVLKYELKVGRIRRASIVKVIPSVGYKKELCRIGESEEEAIF